MLRDFNQNGHGFPSTVAMIFTAALGVLGFTGGILGKAEPRGQPRAAVQQTPTGIRLRSEGEMPSLDSAARWLNSRPLAATELRGKVVLIEFWTYSCINWRRQLPYVRAWSEKYKSYGLVVIGVHTPEFGFEKNIGNVRQAAKAMRVTYPIALDNDYGVWRAFRNEYWPALYFVDAHGQIRHHQFGEGEYEKAEAVIQQLLAETGASGFGHDLVMVNAEGAEAAADWGDLRSQENYVGYERTENFASPNGPILNRSNVYAVPQELRINHWALAGDWTMKKEVIILKKAHGRITYRFHARDLHLVMGPATPGKSVRFRVFINGHQPGAAHGADIDSQGNGTVTEPRMYQLIRQRSHIVDQEFAIEFLDSGVEAFSFTFG